MQSSLKAVAMTVRLVGEDEGLNLIPGSVFNKLQVIKSRSAVDTTIFFLKQFYAIRISYDDFHITGHFAIETD